MTELNVTERLRSNVLGAYGDEAARWLEALPVELERAREAWGLRDIAAYPIQSFNHVAQATTSDGQSAVLKLGVPSRDSRFEAIAMGAFGGAGAAKVLRSDLGRGWLLLERLEPGETLLSLKGEAQRIAAVASVGQGLWAVPVERGAGLPHIREHFSLLRETLERPKVPMNQELLALVQRAYALFDVLSDDARDRVLHGDLHHLNIISHGERWAVIDAKGVIGDPLYDLGAYFRNPLPQLEKPSWDELIELRVKGFAKALGESEQRIAQWAFCVAVLRALWGMAMGFEGWQAELKATEGFLPHLT